ncbi:MAG: PilZ domain-containing protein [Candidatus Firestonebacteria bacterium]
MIYTKSKRRKYTRISAVVMAELFSLPDKKIIGKACITDLSLGGMRVETNEPLKTDDMFLIKFSLPNGQYFDKIKSKIVRSAKVDFTFTYGIKFTEINLIDRIRLWLFSLKAKRE